MLLVAAFLLAVFVLSPGWGLVVVVLAGAAEVGEVWLWWRWSRRRRPAIGIEAMIGSRATVTTPCRPLGQVRLRGELWTARCDGGADTGDEVEVVGVEGLTLVVGRP